MAMYDYEFLEYTLPPKSSKSHALRAVEVLREIKNEFPEQYERSFRCPSEILTLSGVRALDTYYELGTSISDSEIKRLQDLLWKYGLVLIVQTNTGNKSYDAEKPYLLIHADAVREIPKRYRQLPGWKKLDTKKGMSDMDYLVWWYAWKERIGLVYDNPSNEIAKLLRTYPGVHDLAFGVMLGYPGPAIMSAIIDGAKLNGDIGTEATISHYDRFDGAQPNYYYAKTLENDEFIKSHQQLWSEILEMVYAKLDKNVHQNRLTD